MPGRKLETANSGGRLHRILLLLFMILQTCVVVLCSPSAQQAQLPPGTTLDEDSGHRAINDPGDDDAAPADPDLPIRATIYSGVPGPKHCRGAPVAVLDLPRPVDLHTAELCYDVDGGARSTSAGCGVFVANKVDGCEARLFAEPGCRTYVNTAVFQAEMRPVGGSWRSMAVRCGVVPPDPDSLGVPPLSGMIMKHQG